MSSVRLDLDRHWKSTGAATTSALHGAISGLYRRGLPRLTFKIKRFLFVDPCDRRRISFPSLLQTHIRDQKIACQDVIGYIILTHLNHILPPLMRPIRTSETARHLARLMSLTFNKYAHSLSDTIKSHHQPERVWCNGIVTPCRPYQNTVCHGSLPKVVQLRPFPFKTYFPSRFSSN